MSKIVAARVVAIGPRGTVCSAAKARTWDIELTFALGGTARLKRDFRVRSLAVRELAGLLAQARTAGLDARPMVRATCTPVLTLVKGGAK